MALINLLCGGRVDRGVFQTVIAALLMAALLPILNAAVAEEGIPTRTAVRLFEIKRTATGPLSLPSDVAVDKRRIYIVDGGNHRIAVYDKQGKFLFSFGREGVEDGEFRGPVGIDVDRDGMIYVADAGNYRIQIFNSRGKFSG